MKATKEYRKHLEDLDRVLTYLKEKATFKDFVGVRKILSEVGISSNENTPYDIAGILEKDGYVKKVLYSGGGLDIVLLPEGLDFIIRGGYINQLNAKEQREELETKVAKSTVKYHRTNVIFSVINFIFFIANLIIAYLNLLKK